MTMIVRAVLAAGLLASLPVAAAAQAPALARGSALIGGSVHASFDKTEGVDGYFAAALSPRVEYFVSDGFSLGGQATVSYFRQDDASSTGLGLGPAVTYYFVRSASVHPYLRATGTYSRASYSGDLGSFDDWSVAGSAGLLFLLGDAVGVNGELYVSRRVNDGLLDQEIRSTSAGFRAGVSAFVF